MNEFFSNNIKNDVSLLTQHTILNYNYLLSENDRLRTSLLDLEDKSKKQDDYIKTLEQINYINTIYIKEKEKDKVEPIVKSIKEIIYKKTKKSFSDTDIQILLDTINSIEDIIKLKNYWYQCRHNIIIKKLILLIPLLTKINNMVGMIEVKKDMFKKIIYFTMNPHNNEYLHTVISGPPGVGKTELAKLYGKIFAKLGILKTDNFVEIKRSDLVGEYLGHTAPKTKKLLESAMGGVLFLDEAYSLGNSDKKDSFSKEAIDLLNMYLSERKGEFMFIIAGYEDDIEDCLFSHNKGMKRRFQSYYNIKPYNSKELMEIFLLKLKESNYYTNIKDDLDEFFIENKDSFQYYGGDIEKLINEIKYVQCYRVFKSGCASREVLLADIKEGFKNMKIKEKENNMMYL